VNNLITFLCSEFPVTSLLLIKYSELHQFVQVFFHPGFIVLNIQCFIAYSYRIVGTLTANFTFAIKKRTLFKSRFLALVAEQSEVNDIKKKYIYF